MLSERRTTRDRAFTVWSDISKTSGRYLSKGKPNGVFLARIADFKLTVPIPLPTPVFAT